MERELLSMVLGNSSIWKFFITEVFKEHTLNMSFNVSKFAMM